MPAISEPSSAQRTKDALWIFDQLMDLRSPVVIDVNAIAAKENAKVNTVVKRFSTLRLRYPGLSIQATTTASGKPSTRTTNKISSASPTAPKTPKTRAGKRKAGIPNIEARLESARRRCHERKSNVRASPEDKDDDDDETVKAVDDGEEEDDDKSDADDPHATAGDDVRPPTRGGYEWQTYAEDMESED